MNSEEPSKMRTLFKKYDILMFYLIALLISWGGWYVIDILFRFIPANPDIGQILSEGRYDIIVVSLVMSIISIVSVWGPLLSAFIVYRVNYGKAGTRGLLKKIFKWRVAIPWYVIAIGVPIFIKYGTYYLNVWFLGGGFISDLERVSIFVIVARFFDQLIPSGGQEEVGWTGFAQLRLQQQMPVIPATLVKTLMGWIWHLPLYLVFQWSGIFGGDIWVFLMYYTPIAFIYTWLFNNTDSVLLPALFHAAFNTVGAFAITIHASWDTVPINNLILILLTCLIVGIAFLRDGWNLTRKELPKIVDEPMGNTDELETHDSITKDPQE